MRKGMSCGMPFDTLTACGPQRNIALMLPQVRLTLLTLWDTVISFEYDDGPEVSSIFRR